MAGNAQLIVHRRSHHIMLLPQSDTAAVIIEGFCRRLIEYSLVPDQGKAKEVATQVYAVNRLKGKEYRIQKLKK